MRRYLDTNYLVSESGDVFNLKTGKKIKNQDNGKGYRKITLTINGKPVQKYVHRMVAECYLLNKSIQVNHKDGNKSNNCVSNLEWCTNSQNQIHAHANGLKKSGSDLWNAKFTKEQIFEIKKYRNNGLPYHQIAKIFNTTKSTIHAIVNNNRYKNISYV